jgi:3-hydroxyisobutyrate dehydrogenase-like beta-hydroxyacid dehydrogenase
MTTIGFVGLGLMGSSLCKSLLGGGFEVLGYDLDPERCRELDERGGKSVSSIAEAVGGVPIVVLSLPNGDIVREVCLGEGGIVGSAAPGLVVIDTTTARPADSIATAEELARAGVVFLDASLSGTSKMAETRDLIAMVGGPQEAYERIGPVLDALARARYYLGPVGSGVRAKLVVNLALGVSRVMLAEALVLGERAGMDLEALLEVLKDSVAYSRVMDVYGTRMVAGDHLPPTSRLKTHTKTVNLILEFGHDVGVPLWLTPVVAQILQIGRLTGMSDWDSTATIEVLRRLTGEGRVPEEPSVS